MTNNRRIRVLLQLCLSLSLAVPCLAQQTPAWEVLGGYSFQRAEMREYFRSTPSVYATRNRQVHLHGAEASVTENRNDWFGGTLYFSFHEREAIVAGSTSQLAPTTNRQRTYSILYGPRFSYRTARMTPFVHILMGAANTKVWVSPVGPNESDTSFAVSVGGGLDVNLRSRLALRVFQADYLRTDVLGASPHRYKASAGIIFRLGER